MPTENDIRNTIVIQDELSALRQQTISSVGEPDAELAKEYERLTGQVAPRYAPNSKLKPKGIGDIESANRGTAARYNSGKPRVDLLPLYMVVKTINCDGFSEVQWDVFNCLSAIAEFQRSGEERHLDTALEHLHRYWLECADVFGYGAQKYASWNWVKGMAWSIPIGCIGRHSFAVFRGELNDTESTLPHVGHILCNVVMLKAYFSGFEEGNDLPPKGFKV